MYVPDSALLRRGRRLPGRHLACLPDIAGVLGDIDADFGGSETLLILADWLEEQGDPRADGLREAVRLKRRPGDIPMPNTWAPGYYWYDWSGTTIDYTSWGCYLTHAQFAKLCSFAQHRGCPKDAIYPTRSAAYLGLAGALSTTTTAVATSS